MLLIIKIAVNFIINILVLALVFTFTLILTLKPSTLLNPVLLVLVSLALFSGGACLTYLGNKRKPKFFGFQAIKNLTRKNKAIVVFTLLVVFLSLTLVPSYISHVKEQKLLEPAKQQFAVVMINEVSESQMNNTLVELQKNLTRLRDKYVVQPPNYVITVNLYWDINELHKHTEVSDWASAYVEINTGEPPELFIPTEEGGGFWTKTAPTSNPTHEITHIAVYEAIGLKPMSLIPSSFHEGLAQYESFKGPQNIFDRFVIRLWLLWQRQTLSNRVSIPDYYAFESNEDISAFYCISYEYIRYLATIYGEDKIWHVVQLVGNNISFDDAFITVFGKSYSEYYRDFIVWYY